MQTEWMTWESGAKAQKPEPGTSVLQLYERLLGASLEKSTAAQFLQSQMPEVAAELSAQWVAILERSPEWKTTAECGRHTISELPFRFFEEVLDRNEGCRLPLGEPAGWSLVAAPLGMRSASGRVLVAGGRALSGETLPAVLAVARVLSICLRIAGIQEKHARRVKRLERTLEVAASFSGERDSESLLERIAEAATQLLDCDRSSIFIWDKDHKQVVACPALGVEGGTLRLPDNVGIVGEVIQSGKGIRVDDPYSDPRFNKRVDEESGYITRNLICQPLLDAEGNQVGAFEGINKNDGAFTDEDQEALSQLGLQAAVALQTTREREQLIRSRRQLTEQITQGVRIIGESPAIVALRATIDRLAATDLPVLILGESGTGKEVVAQALHFHGPRADHPFVAVNCAALTETLLESELFGHERGAFTDARETRQGKFELAEGGTLFLDEIGDMSLGGQAKLLRVLEQKVITRVGGSQAIPINVRVIAATNTNLAEAVRDRRFREDLYYRLSVVTQTLPPLRERPEDILPLAEFFLKQFCVQARRPALKLPAEVRRRLQAHHWPGNVRELRNLMERVVFLGSGDRVEADEISFILSPDREAILEPSTDMSLDKATKQFQQEFIRRAIKRVQGNMSEAARLLGVHRSNLYRKMRQLVMKEVGGNE